MTTPEVAFPAVTTMLLVMCLLLVDIRYLLRELLNVIKEKGQKDDER